MRISDWSSDVCSSDLSAVSSSGAVSASATNSVLFGYLKVTLYCTPSRLACSSTSQSVATTLSSKMYEWVAVRTIMLVSTSTFLGLRSEEHTSELQSLMRISYAVFCLKKKK